MATGALLRAMPKREAMSKASLNPLGHSFDHETANLVILRVKTVSNFLAKPAPAYRTSGHQADDVVRLRHSNVPLAVHSCKAPTCKLQHCLREKDMCNLLALFNTGASSLSIVALSALLKAWSLTPVSKVMA